MENKERILVVEDEKSITNFISTILATNGFDTLTAETGAQALMLMYGKEASNRKQEIDRQHYTIPNQRPKDKHCGKI